MTDQTSTDALRERLTDLLAEWGTEMSAVLTELEQSRSRLGSMESDFAERANEAAELGEQLRGRDELIARLRSDAEAATAETEAADGLRGELNARDLEIERLNSELETKRDLISALRRDTEGLERLKAEAAQLKAESAQEDRELEAKTHELEGKTRELEATNGELEIKDRELETSRRERDRLDAEVRRLQETVGSLEQAAAAGSAEDKAEVESLRAELEARKSLIRSLRADAERAQMLEGRLEEKRRLIQQLEATINRHANTIVELKRNAEGWKRKYRSLDGSDATTTTFDPPAVGRNCLPAGRDGLPRLPEALLGADSEQSDKTVAIDMRQSLLEARRAAQSGNE